MTKIELEAACDKYKSDIHDALQLIWDSTNKGQRNKMLKNTKIKALLDIHGVNYG